MSESSVEASNLNSERKSVLEDADYGGFDPSVEPLTQFHQKLRSGYSQYSYWRQVPFTGTAALGQENTVQIPSFAMIPHKAAIELVLPAVGTSTAPTYAPSYRWVNYVDLRYQGKTVLRCYQSLFENEFYLDQEPKDYLTLSLPNSEWVTTGNTNATTPVPFYSGRQSGAAANVLYLSLEPLMRILRHIGPVDSYDALSWSIVVNLRTAAQCTCATDAAAGTISAITSMKLLLGGHKSSYAYARLIRDRLNDKKGINIYFLNPTNQRLAVATGDTSASQAFPGVEGNLSHVYIRIRTQAALDAVLGNAIVPGDIAKMVAYGATTQVGYTSNYDAIYGSSVQNLALIGGLLGKFNCWGPSGTNMLLNTSVNLDTATTDNIEYDFIRNNSIIPICFGEHASADSAYGGADSTIYVKNDFILNFAMPSTAQGAFYMDFDLYMADVCNLRSDGANVMRAR